MSTLFIFLQEHTQSFHKGFATAYGKGAVQKRGQNQNQKQFFRKCSQSQVKLQFQLKKNYYERKFSDSFLIGIIIKVRSIAMWRSVIW